MTITKGKYGIAVFALYMTAFSAVSALSFVQAYRTYQSYVAYNSPTAVHARLVKSYDKEKDAIMEEVSNVQIASAIAVREAADAEVRAKDYADKLKIEANLAIDFWNACNDANQLGTDAPPVDCSTIVVTDAEPVEASGSVEDVIEGLGLVGEKEPVMFEPTRTHLFVNWGHGLNEDGKWRDDGAVAADGTTERSLVMGIAETAYNHAKKSERLTSVIPVGKEPYSLRDNVNYATDHASKLGCGRTERCYLLSVHANKSTDQSKTGTVAYYNPYSVESRQFAASLAACMGGSPLSDQSNRFGRLAMVRDVEQVDGVLLETGYLSNPSDLNWLKSGQAGSKLAKCVNAFFDNR
jgi:N-acetylmuramoyl-L-alanine amidase